MAAAGAAAGTAVMPGIGTAVGGIIGAVVDGFMDDKGGGGSVAAPSAPSAAAAAVYGSSNLNADNWSVNFSGTQNNSPRVDKAFSATGPTASTAAGGGILPAPVADALGAAGIPSWALYVVGGLLLWKLVK